MNFQILSRRYKLSSSKISPCLTTETVPKEDQPPLPKKLNYGNNSYWILQKKLSWYKAWGECKQSGGDLASISDESQQVFLEDIVKRDGFPLWFGLSIHDVSLVLLS